MKKTEFLCIALVCLIGVATVKSSEIQRNLSDNIIRMHITANSNSEKDQNIKLKVRDRVINMKNLSLAEAEKTANAVLYEENATYTAKASYKERYVPKKEYKNIALPEGLYNCIDITLGSGEGENWWCIAYPPLCFSEAILGEVSDAGKKALKKKLTKEAMETIIKNGDVNFKFKTVEELQKLLRYLE